MFGRKQLHNVNRTTPAAALATGRKERAMRINPRRWLRSVISVLMIGGLLTVLAPPALADCQPTPSDRLPEGYRVQVPSDYCSSTRSYPVLYLFPGGNGDENYWFNIDPDLASLADQGVIIVSVPTLGLYNDWRKAPVAIETLYTETLIEVIDSTYRTIPDRAYRAVAGVSDGGYGAMLYASRHPDLYTAAASFSGPLNITDPTYLGASVALQAVVGPAFGFVFGGAVPGAPSTGDPLGSMMPIFGDPIQDEVWWHGRNPTDLAPNLGGVDVWHASGDGKPRPDEVTPDDLQGDPAAVAVNAVVKPVFAGQAVVVETLARRHNDSFDRALTEASIPHTYRARPGIHWDEYAVADLHEWFPVMLEAFGAPAPQSFDYRSVDDTFSVWGWGFETHHARATEWFEVDNASSSGLTVTGSGLTTITTASLFEAGQSVLLDGATTRDATADSQGRISFQLDLGGAHQLQQYTAAQRAAEAAAAGNYFTTKTVTFFACPGRSPAHACQRHAGTPHGSITP